MENRSKEKHVKQMRKRSNKPVDKKRENTMKKKESVYRVKSSDIHGDSKNIVKTIPKQSKAKAIKKPTHYPRTKVDENKDVFIPNNKSSLKEVNAIGQPYQEPKQVSSVSPAFANKCSGGLNVDDRKKTECEQRKIDEWKKQLDWRQNL